MTSTIKSTYSSNVTSNLEIRFDVPGEIEIRVSSQGSYIQTLNIEDIWERIAVASDGNGLRQWEEVFLRLAQRCNTGLR